MYNTICSTYIGILYHGLYFWLDTYNCHAEAGKNTSGMKKYIKVLSVPNSTHGNSVVSLPIKPKNRKLSMKNQAILRADSLSLFDTPTQLSIIGKTYNITTDNTKAQIPIVLSSIERKIA